MNLATSLESIKGVGPKTASQLRQAGLETVGDLIDFYPRRYEDYSEVVSIADITPGKRTIKAKVDTVEVKRVKRGMTITTASLVDSSGGLQAVWFNQPYRVTQLKSGDEFYFSGNFEFRYNRYQLANPSAEKVSDMPVQTDRILPIYRAIKGLKSQLVRTLIVEMKSLISVLPETLPQALIDQEELLDRATALLRLHYPQTISDIQTAKRRLAFEELFQLMLASRLNQDANRRLEGVPMKFDLAATKQFIEKLPFTLTDSQRLATWEIIQDLESSAPMNRMLQGDVGSGKTVVAGLAALTTALNGYQTAIMAPTEILARQHAATLESLLAPFNISVGLLVGAVKGKARQLLYDNIQNGEVSVVVGTHALFQDKVIFKSLGLSVIDEQHRFGVAERQKMVDKAHRMPHILTMTATPIPRSLQLTVFGELAVSVLKDRPKNRLPIITNIVNPVSRAKAYNQIKQQLDIGHQAYVIAPLINDSNASDKKSIETELKRLKNSCLGGYAMGVLHGQMKADEKDQMMIDFKAGKFDILLSTTVVEVGVDVPNATIMLIENADQFGLAQLHQLRGRVGRSSTQSYCLLVTSDSQKPSKRLLEIEKSNDGFYLAEVDLQLRGPGEIYGRAQHGELNLKIASLADTNMIATVQRAVEQFMISGEDLLQYKQLAAAVSRYQRLTTLN
ncbi:MAG TPA: ATP-dependent DNA helicase RecG [Candidatus Saccharibacteria bacterium]|nr:ATP-dependent DNA helicase RecG [Candidatus Saccharibacteria bacterium]HMR38237.1 ATP-dependent DNA helicase RecG [Candidatus Saccharibacteria bacterium]